MEVNEKWAIVDVKLHCLKILSSLMYDEIYSNKDAARELRIVIKFLDDMEEELS